jgi:hypothetical protein
MHNIVRSPSVVGKKSNLFIPKFLLRRPPVGLVLVFLILLLHRPVHVTSSEAILAFGGLGFLFFNCPLAR